MSVVSKNFFNMVYNIYPDRFIDFPEYSQYQMPDNQIVSPFQSIFNQKNHFDFFSFRSIQVWIICFKNV